MGRPPCWSPTLNAAWLWKITSFPTTASPIARSSISTWLTIHRSVQASHRTLRWFASPGTGGRSQNSNESNSGSDFPINRAIIEQNGSAQLVYYWYEERGRTIASEYWSKWYLLYDAITKNRSDGALVRLITTISPGEVERDADKRLQLFIRELRPTLAGYLPSSNASKALALEYGLESRTPRN